MLSDSAGPYLHHSSERRWMDGSGNACVDTGRLRGSGSYHAGAFVPELRLLGAKVSDLPAGCWAGPDV